MKKKVVAIIQARMGSTRLPGKTLMEIEGKTLLEHIIQRIGKAKTIDGIVVATTSEEADKRIISAAEEEGVESYAGSVDDVLDRFYQAARKAKADVIVRITADDPFKDPEVIDHIVGIFLEAGGSLDYASNTIETSYPEGLDIEVFSFEALKRAWSNAKKASEREHVTPYIWKNPDIFRVRNVKREGVDLSSLRWTLDNENDLRLAREIYKRLYPKKRIFLMADILALLEEEPHLVKINEGSIKYEGYVKSLIKDKTSEKMAKKLWRIGSEELAYIKDAVESGLTGKYNAELEKRFAEKFGVKYAIGVNSGTSALHTALAAMGIGPGDEVITTPLTFAATGFSPLLLGAVPVFADVDPDTYNIDPESIEKKITKRTKAILPVHLYGLPADMDEIMRIAKEHSLFVLEDSAECIMGRCKGKIAGTIGDMGIYSFERSKHLTTGNGGMIVTDNEAMADKARKFSVLGYSTLKAGAYGTKPSKDVIQDPNFNRHLFIAPNYRLPELCAAMGLAQMDKMDMLVKKREDIGEIYAEAIEGCSLMKPQKTPKEYVNSYWTFAMEITKKDLSWYTFRKIFLEEGGDTFYAAWKLTYMEPALYGKELCGIKYREGLCPIAERLQPRLIQLKTNYESLEEAKEQAEVLKRTIKKLEKA
jgi:perosamine synthetase